VLNGANEIHSASNDLSNRNEQQAATLEETAAAMNQVTEGVRESARSAHDVQKSITEAHEEATEGGIVVSRAVEAMAAIERSAQEINQIIGVIDGIAFQPTFWR
jgi:methyl-accepting chemotaxis protein